MNKPFRALSIASLCLAGVLLAAFASAQPGAKVPPAAPAVVAIVDLAKLTKNLDEAQLLSDRLQKQKDDSMKKLQEVKDELKAVTTNLEGMPKEKKGSAEFLQQLARKFELEATLKARLESQQQLLDIAEGENMKLMFTKVVDTVARVAKERAYDLVLWDDRSISPPNIPATGAQVWSVIRDRRILYAADRLDITNDVLTQMNNEFKTTKK